MHINTPATPGIVVSAFALGLFALLLAQEATRSSGLRRRGFSKLTFGTSLMMMAFLLLALLVSHGP